MLTKEKIDKQLAGQSYSTPFMSMRYSQSKKFSFNTQDNLEQKIDKLMVMMGKLVTEDEGCSKPFRPQIYQSGRGRDQNRGNFHGRFRNKVYRGCTSYNQNLEVDIGVTLITEKIMVIMLEVVRDTEIIIMITEGTIIEVKIMIEIAVGH